MLKRAIIALLLTASVSRAQSADTVVSSRRYWIRMGTGAATSILIHEAGHIGASIISGAHPTFGFNRARPTVYSGIDANKHPRTQFWFSSAGLDVQNVLDEAILDIPHNRGSAFERGLLGGGIGTTLFYLTIGRNGAVSDVEFMSHTGIMNKTQVTVLYGSIIALHTWRIARNPAYANFFALPRSHGLDFGVSRRF
ncbi:MAG TPA: hypothetical protein VGM82_23030 [Gemmatimonadaceae bacterium]|jgi:hypothetical protein